MINQYKCNRCGKTVGRDSEKKWIKSVCDETGKTVRLIKIELTKKLKPKIT